ncbi:MAG TPA: zinc ABC transporter substrate-binding protein [Burkholderiales bacterium]
MKHASKVFLAVVLAVLAAPAFAALNVFACEPEWAALAGELGGDKVNVYAATTALQDAHHIEARPSLIARARSADLLICSGSELEIGWVPLLLTQAGNSRIQPGSPGYLEASQFVQRIEIPKVVDRSLGDIHPAGNPHVHTDPRNIARVAEVLTQRLAQLDPADAEVFKARAESFKTRWQGAIARWEKEGARLKGVPVVVFHKDLSYFLRWMGMNEVGSLEPRPGIPPTPAHLAELVEQMKRAPARVIVYSPYNDAKAAQFLSERTGIPAALMPFTVGGTDKAKDLVGLFDDTIARLLAVVK